jgi:hypothetical protein
MPQLVTDPPIFLPQRKSGEGTPAFCENGQFAALFCLLLTKSITRRTTLQLDGGDGSNRHGQHIFDHGHFA